MKIITIILKSIIIALFAFITKHLVQAFVEYSDIIKISPKVYRTDSSINLTIYYVILEFVYAFWLYYLIVLLFSLISYFFIRKKKKLLYISLIVSTVIFTIWGLTDASYSNYNDIFEGLIISPFVGYVVYYLVYKYVKE